MLLIIEIILVLGAFLILIGSGVTTTKSAIKLGRTTKNIQGHVAPRVRDLSERNIQAGRFAISIMETRDLLFVRLGLARISFGKLLVSIRALSEVRRKVSDLLEYIGR